MAERKTKWSEKEQEKKLTKRTISTKKTEKIEKKEKPIIKRESSISRKSVAAQKKEDKLSFRVVFLFFFSLAFLLFSLYKVFIYWKWYSNPSEGSSVTQSSVFSIKNIPNDDSNIQEPSIPEPIEVETPITEEPINETDEISNDINLIQNFYTHLVNNEIEEMDQLVDSPLRTSATWRSHWSSKNIWIFTKHILDDNISLDNISLVAWSDNKEKKTRKYSYTLSYTIDTNESFNEGWEVTLLDRGEKTLISEIMCKTDWCSHSPFFWPQNYNLK